MPVKMNLLDFNQEQGDLLPFTEACEEFVKSMKRMMNPILEVVIPTALSSSKIR